MEAPFRHGDRAAIFTLRDDQLIVTTTEVHGVVESPDESWQVLTHDGTFRVADRDGISDTFITAAGEPAWLATTDPELDFELREKGEGFVVLESLSDLEVSREDRLRNLVDFELPSLDREDGDHGWER
jgi:hypothetical protein